MSNKIPAVPASIVKRPSRIIKEHVEVEFIFHDGTRISGNIFLGQGQRVQDLLNESKMFIPLLQDSGEILLVSKSAVAVCKPLDQPG